MKTKRSKFLLPVGMALIVGFFATAAHSWDGTPEAPLLLAQGAPDCYAIGQQVAAQQGGTLAGASAENQGGGTVCRIVILVPAKDGERPRRVEITVPAQ